MHPLDFLVLTVIYPDDDPFWDDLCLSGFCDGLYSPLAEGIAESFTYSNEPVPAKH